MSKVPRGWRGALLGVGISLFSLLPMGDALFAPTEASMPSGRLPAFLAGAVFLLAGVLVALMSLGRSGAGAVATMVSLFAGVPMAIAAQGAAGPDATPGSLLVLGIGTTALGVLAGYLWSSVLRDRTVARREGRPAWRVASGSLAGIALASPFLAMVTPLGAAAGVALPVLVAAAATGRVVSEERRAKLASIALSLAAMPLVVAPARALAGLLAWVGGVRFDDLISRLVRADPLAHACLDAATGVGGVLSVAALAAAGLWVPASQRGRAAMLPDRAHGLAALVLSSALALDAAADLWPEKVPWRRPDLGGVERALPAEALRILARVEGGTEAWRRRALQDAAEADLAFAPAIPHLLGLLDHPDAGVRSGAATLLRVRARPGPEHRDRLPRLRELLDSREPELQRLALNVLPAMTEGDPETLRAVMASAARAHTYAYVRDEAMTAVAAEGDAARAVLVDALEHGPPELRGVLVRTLESMVASPAARLELHRGLLASDDPVVRAWAVPGLAALAPEQPEAAAELVALVRDGGELAEPALDALVSSAPAALDDLDDVTLAPYLGARMWSTRVAVRERIEARGASASLVIPVLLRMLQEGDLYAREEAMRDLTKLGAPPEAAPLVATAIAESSHQNLRVAAAALVATMGEHAAPAVPALVTILEGNDTYAAGHAADALRTLGPHAAAAAPDLERLLRAGAPVLQGVLPAYAAVTAPPRRLLDASAGPLFSVDGAVREPSTPLPLHVGPSFTIELSVRVQEGATAAFTLLDAGFLVVNVEAGRRLSLSYRLGEGVLTGTSPSTGPQLDPGRWHRIAVSHDRAAPCGLTLHVDGRAHATLSAYGWSLPDGLRVLPERIERLQVGGAGFGADVADLRVHDGVLARPAGT